MDDRSRLRPRGPHLRVLAFAAAVLIAATACMQRAAPGALYDASVITEEEIDSAHAVTALEAVRKLRPMFLVSRGKVEFGTPNALPNVYVDNQYYGDISTLRAISAASIETIKFYTGSEAQYKFGRGNVAGVIGIFTKH